MVILCLLLRMQDTEEISPWPGKRSKKSKCDDMGRIAKRRVPVGTTEQKSPSLTRSPVYSESSGDDIF